ncbi:MAG: PrgI family protein [Patescibacteria group bacterium]
MKQFQVPQFIDVEDKILGPITMRQFFIMLIPFGTGILLYFILTLWLAIIFTIPVIAVAALFAFYKPYGMRFSRFFAAFLSYAMKPRMYIWHRDENVITAFSAGKNAVESDATHPREPHMAAPGHVSGLRDKRSSIEVGSAYRGTDTEK